MDKYIPPALQSVNRRPTADLWYVLPSEPDGRTYQKSANKSNINRIDRKGLSSFYYGCYPKLEDENTKPLAGDVSWIFYNMHVLHLV